MKRHTIAWIVAFVMGATALAHAVQFTMDLYLDSSTGKTLTFGMAAEGSVDGLPPMGPDMKFPWLEGPGDMSQSVENEDFGKLSKYIKADADAALWKLYVNKDMKITFKLADGQLPAGSILKLYPEGAEDEAVDLADGVAINAKENTTYLIDYRKTSTTEIALPSPTVKRFQISGNKAEKSWVLEFDIPDGCTLCADELVTAYSGEKVTGPEGTYTVFTPMAEGCGSFLAESSTLLMEETVMADVARIQFNYWLTDGNRTSEKAVVIVDVVDGLATTLVSRIDAATSMPYTGAVVAVDPDEDGYDGTILTYRIDFDAETQGQSLNYSVDTPQFAPTSTAYSVTYAFSETEEYGGDYTDLPAGGVFAYASEANVIYLKLKVAVAGKSESGKVTPSVTVGETQIDMPSVQFAVVSGGTMDIDGDGVITVEDAVMLYNFVTSLGFEFPDFIDVDTITDGIVVTAEQAEHALAVLKSAPAFLDYDGDGEKTVEDAIMMYNFITSLGVEFPDFVDIDTITDGIVVDDEFAEIALANFKKYSQK